ncbi:MAG TPA: serine/threonine-protein kinase [Polyangia bacterium]|jgi:serine/threonine-protein kinase|nr:serine/threonine-protein kinase [Polyangia bacterium]
MSLQSRYTILRKITDGGTAEIFLAKQHGAQGFEKTVVLKRIFTTFYADPQFRHMLVDEAHVAMSLNHSNIVQVLDLGEADGRYFLALELVDGWTLDRILKRTKAAGVPIPPALALYVTAEVCRALAYAHAKKRSDGKPLGIVHRDVSPHNVMMSAEGEVKLTDFGIAKAQNKTEKSLGNLIKGKVAFMSPEQAAAGELDGRSDLFSVGTMLYAMITRRHPFDAPTDYETLMLVKNGDFLPPETARPGLNPELYRVIRKAMGKTPEARYQKAEEMLIDVEQVMRVAFRPVGQTELQRWLADLSSKDGVPALTREAPPEPPASRSTVGPLRAGSGQESGLVLTLDDAVEVRSSDRPPPPPSGATEVMTHPPQFAIPDRAWHRKPSVRIAGAGALLLLGALVSARALSGRHGAAPVVATAVAPGPGSVAPLPPPTPPAPAPAALVPAPPSAAPAADAQAAPASAPPAAKPDAPGAAGSAGAGAGVAARQDEAPPAGDDQPNEAPAEAESHPVSQGKSGQLPVVIKSDPEGSHVATGRHLFGTTPLTLKLRPGNSYDLTFTRPGYATVTRHYKFDGHGPQILRVSLKKIPEPHKAAASLAAPTKPAPPPPKKNNFFSR